MLNRLFAGGSLPALEAMLTFASARQKLIATNIANVDTAGYRTRDLAIPDFSGVLARSLRGGRRPAAAGRRGPFGLPRGVPARPPPCGADGLGREGRRHGLFPERESDGRDGGHDRGVARLRGEPHGGRGGQGDEPERAADP